MEPKKYSAASLLTMCHDHGNSEVKEVLSWHDLKDDGLWLSKPRRLVVGNDLETMEWHPRKNCNLPALPIPFSAYELAAFFLAGGGVFLRDEFEDGESLDESALEGLGTNAVDERQVLREAHRLYLEASIRFGRTDQGTREAADWLLNHAFEESIAVAEDQRKQEPELANTCLTPAIAECLPNGMPTWALNQPKRNDGFAFALFAVLTAKHNAGFALPNARDVLEALRKEHRADVHEVGADEVTFFDGRGNLKTADLEDIRKRIARMTTR